MPDLTRDEIAAARRHFLRISTPAMREYMDTPNEHGLKPGDDPEVLRAWAQRAMSDEGAVAIFAQHYARPADDGVARKVAERDRAAHAQWKRDNPTGVDAFADHYEA